MRFHIPIKLPSLANTRMSWQAMARLKGKQRRAVLTAIRVATRRIAIPPPPLVIMITRVGPRKLDDDNLQSACKYVRDEIARYIGLDDGSPQYTWMYDQRVGEYGVEVEITSRL